MRITKEQLRKLVKEVLQESTIGDDEWENYGGDTDPREELKTDVTISFKLSIFQERFMNEASIERSVNGYLTLIQGLEIPDPTGKITGTSITKIHVQY